MMAVGEQKKARRQNMLLSGVGCFLLLILFAFVTVTAVFSIFAMEIIKEVRVEAKLPDFVIPTELDFIELQQKLLLKANNRDYDDGGDEDDFFIWEWHLTSGEYNALLSSIEAPPIKGFCLSKVRYFPSKPRTSSFVVKNSKPAPPDTMPRYYLIGSGYMMKKLVISFDVGRYRHGNISDIKINNYEVPSDSFLFSYVVNLINEIAANDSSKILKKVLDGDLNLYQC